MKRRQLPRRRYDYTAVLEWSKRRDAGKTVKAFDQNFNPFKPGKPTPGVVPKGAAIGHNGGPKMAMDDATLSGFCGFGTSWPSFYGSAAASQGYVFLGYPFLSQLSTIAEYRVVAEVIATEATRNWIEFNSDATEEDDEDGEDPEADEEASEEAAQPDSEGAQDEAPPDPAQLLEGEEQPDEAFEAPPDPEEEAKKAAQKKRQKEKTERIKAIEKRLTELNAKACFYQLICYDSFFGGGHLYLDTGDSEKPQELETDLGAGRDDTSSAKVSPSKPLLRIAPIEPTWIYPAVYNASNPLKPDWYKPEKWYVFQQLVHESRLLRFVAHEVPDLLKPAYMFRGIARSQMIMPYVDNWLRNRQSASDMLHSFSVMVLCTDLSTTTMVDGDQLQTRLQAYTQLRDNKDIVAVNKDTEDFKNVSAPLGGIDDLVAQSQEQMASISRIPIVKLLGTSPKGLNATGDAELQVFYENILAFQESFIRPGLQRVIDFIQLSLFSNVDPDITFDFAPLHSLTELEQADMRKSEADSHSAYVEMGAISQEEVRKAVAENKDSPYRGIDVEKMPVNPAEQMPQNVEGKPVGARHIIGQEEDPETGAVPKVKEAAE